MKTEFEDPPVTPAPPVQITIRIHPVLAERLDAILNFGHWGVDRSEAAARLVSSGILQIEDHHEGVRAKRLVTDAVLRFGEAIAPLVIAKAERDAETAQIRCDGARAQAQHNAERAGRRAAAGGVPGADAAGQTNAGAADA